MSDDIQPIDLDSQSLYADMQQSIGRLPIQKPRTKQVAPALRKKRELHALTNDIKHTLRQLQSPTSRTPDNLWKTVDEARGTVSVVALSLQDHPDSPQKVSVLTQLRDLESKLERFKNDLPPDARPLFYDSGLWKFSVLHLQI